MRNATKVSPAPPPAAKFPLGAPQDLHFLALGGSGEIGMNLNLYAYRGKWLMVDLGVTFGDDSTPGVDVIMPDIAFIEERRDALAGLVLTHGHEDHIGAVQYLWPRLDARSTRRPSPRPCCGASSRKPAWPTCRSPSSPCRAASRSARSTWS